MSIRKISCVLSLLILVVLAYSNAIFLPFVHDDLVFIAGNPRINELFDLSGIFAVSPELNQGQGYNIYYRPLLEFFYRLEYRLFGLAPAYYHAVNIAGHALNGVLLLALFLRLGIPMRLAWMSAALFLVHPAQTEAVTCVSGISNILSSIFILAGLLLLTSRRSAVLSEGWRAGVNLALAMLCYVLALLAKESSVVFIGLFFLIEWFSRRYPPPGLPGTTAGGWRQFAGRLAAVCGVTVIYFLWRAVLLGAKAVPGIKFDYELLLRLQSLPHLLLTYAQIIIFPYDLHYYRNIDLLVPPGKYFLLLFLTLFLADRIIRRLPDPNRGWSVLGLGWFLIVIAPTLNIIPIINEYAKLAAFEHFVYLAAAGIFVAATAAASALWTGQKWSGAKRLAAAAVLLLCLVLTWRQNLYWRNELTLFERMITFERDFGRGYRLLSTAYARAGDYPRARAAGEKAREIFQRYQTAAAGSTVEGVYKRISKQLCLELAGVAQAQGDYAQAAADYLAALAYDPSDSSVYNFLGVVYARRQMFDKAGKYFAESINLNPDNPETLSNLAVCYIRQNRKPEAKQLLQRAVALDPGNISARGNLEALLLEMR